MVTADKASYRNMVANGLAIFVLAVTLTAPVHECIHLLTKMAAGAEPIYLAYGVTESTNTIVLLEGHARG